MSIQLLESIFPFRIIESKEIEENGRKLFRVKGVFQRADEINANGRIYPSKLMEREHQALNERLAAGDESVFMQADHPDDGVARVRNTVAIMKSANYDPTSKEVVGEADIIPTQNGNDLKEIIRAGGKVGISARGYGSTQQGEVAGHKGDVVQEDYRLVTYDFVIGQSTRKAVVNNFTEQARHAIEAILAEEKMDVKTMDLATLKKENPALFAEMEKAAKESMITAVAQTVKEKTEEIKAGLLATLEVGTDGKVRMNGEELKLTKKSGGRGGDRGDANPAQHVCTEAELEAAAQKLGFTLEKKKKADEDDEDDMDEAQVRANAKRLGFKVIEGGAAKTESEQVKFLKKSLEEVTTSLKDVAGKVTVLASRDQNSNVMARIIEKTKDEKRYKNALMERLKETCKTPEEVDAKYEGVKAGIERLLSEAHGGGKTDPIEEIASGDRHSTTDAKAKKYKVGETTEIVELSDTERDQALAAGSYKPGELVEQTA